MLCFLKNIKKRERKKKKTKVKLLCCVCLIFCVCFVFLFYLIANRTVLAEKNVENGKDSEYNPFEHRDMTHANS